MKLCGMRLLDRDYFYSIGVALFLGIVFKWAKLYNTRLITDDDWVEALLFWIERLGLHVKSGCWGCGHLLYL